MSEVQHQQVPVRYDPFDISTIYAYVQKRWVQCRSEHYLQFKGHSERERQLATAELRKQYQNHPRETTITAKRLADFLADLSAHEEVLMQRWHDLEARDVFARMEGIQLFSLDQLQQEEPTPSLVIVGGGSEAEQGERAEQETSKRHPSHRPEIDEDDVDLEDLDEYEEYR